MIRDDFTQAWVTMALSDMEALQALVLAKSLERAYTTRKICILISEGVTREMKYLLMQVFHGIYTITNEELRSAGSMNSEIESIAKMWLWTLNQFAKCVYLNPNYVITNNCDELFKYHQFSAAPLKKGGKLFDPALFVYKPNFETFEQLLRLAGSLKNDAKEDVLNGYFKEWNLILPKHLAFAKTVYSTNDLVDVNWNMDDKGSFPWLANTDSNLENKVSKEWLEIYFQHILPLFKSQKNELVRDFISDTVKFRKFPQEYSPSAEGIVPAEDLTDYKGTIAVVGMSCRFPGANSADEYWKLLSEGREAIRKFPSERVFLGKPQAREMQAGFLNCAIDEFDAKFFGISPREALLVDPQQRLLLEVTWESLENAGINPQTLRDSDTGVYVGMWQQDYERIILESKKEEDNDETTGFLHIFLGNKYSATASRISFCLGLNGPAMAVESGCSSSLNGLHLACESLSVGETSLALVSGVNLILLPFNPFSGKDAGEESVVLSKDYRCKTFDENADGFVRAEACGVVVLKRFEDARRDGDNILAVVKGSAVNNDGQGTSFGTPNEKAQEKVYRAALKNAGIKAADVSYIETHGTGTAVGDPIEMYAVGQAYSENRVNPLLVGSVKTNIGHCEAAAGIASLIKVILCMQNSAIPPHLNLKTLNPRIDLSRIPAQIPMELTPWDAPRKLAAISSFSMSATNAHVILMEAPKSKIQDHLEQEPAVQQHMVTISAKSEEALKDLRRMYINFLEQNPGVALKDIAYIATTGRAHLRHRIAVVASDNAQLLSRLNSNNICQGKAPTIKAKVGFLFTGQGSQYIGMAEGLSEAFPVFRRELDACSALFSESLNEKLENVLWKDENLLSQTLYCQPAIFCVQYCLFQLWTSYGIKPDYVLGHSVGEFAAAVAAGVLTLEDAMKLVVTRSKLVHGLPSGSMTAIRCPEARVSELIKQFIKAEKNDAWVDIAAVNSPEEVVVSGNPETMKRFEAFVSKNGVPTISIPATHAFHSRDMESVLAEFGQTADAIAVGIPTCSYVSGTLARVMDPIEFGGNYWQRHLRDSVRFSDAIRLLWADCKVLLEVGPQPILLGLTMASVDDTSNGVFVPSLRRKDAAETAFYAAMSKLYVAGVDFDWSIAHGTRQKRVNLPLYPFQRERFWYVDELGKDDELSPLLHPLLGRQFLSPVPELLFCQTYRLKELQYMEDHKVADYVIVPVAALLESFMAASREVLQGGSQNKFPITIEDLVVEAALPLENKVRIQTLVMSDTPADDQLQYKLSLNRKMENHFDKWKRHAHAVFTPSSKLPDSDFLDIEALKLRLTQKESLESSYKAIADVGIQFGPRFQSVASAWFGPTDLLTQINLPPQSEDYICHPIVLDAMIQTSAFREYLSQTMDPQEVKKALYLPISIKKFTWLSRVSTPVLYAHSTGKNGNVTLYTSAGEPLGMMEGLELLQTSINSVVRAIRADAFEVPDFLCDKWRPILGKTSARIDINKLIIPTAESPNIAENKHTIKGYAQKDIEDSVEAFDMLLCYAFIYALQECGWPWPEVGTEITSEFWMPVFPKTVNAGVIRLYLEELADRGFLRRLEEPGTFEVMQTLPTLNQCEDLIHEKLTEATKHYVEFSAEISMLERYRKCLPLIFRGKMTPLAFLFPDDESEKGGAQYYYKNAMSYRHQNLLARAFFTDAVIGYQGSQSRDGTLRILEVGAGGGSTTTHCIEVLRELKIPFHYTFTDVSPLFLSEAKKNMNLGPEVSYSLFNVEEDPFAQGYAPNEFDIVLGVQVIHATSDIMTSLANIRKVMRTNGMILLGENFSPNTVHVLIWGMMDGWWRFEDFRVGSRMTALCTAEQWTECLHKTGYDTVDSVPGFLLGAVVARAAESISLPVTLPDVKRKKWLVHSDGSELGTSVIQKLEFHGRAAVQINSALNEDSNLGAEEALHAALNLHLVGASDSESVEGIMYMCTEFQSSDIPQIQNSIVAPLLHLIQGYDKNADKIKAKPRIVLVTRGVYNIGDAEPGNPNGATAWGMMKVFGNEYPNITICLMDLDQAGYIHEVDQVLSHAWAMDGEYFLAFRQDKTYSLRFTIMDKPPLPVQLPLTDRFKLTNPDSGAFTDIEIGPRGKEEVVDDYVELEVKACALNFRDIFMVLKPEGFQLPDDKSLGTLDSVGMDVSGVVVSVGPKVTRFQVGDEVFGVTNTGALGSHTITNEGVLMKMPSCMTFVEACTVPCAFVTAHMALVEVAKITAEDRVLIHVASGGVGLASIQVVNKVGAEIYATAGNKRKRAYLRALGIKYVYHSRNTSFGEGIMRDTNGRGVTVALNSLTGPNFKETTLNACSEGARFVEIAKMNIWKVEEVAALRPDVKYTVVDLSNKEALEGHAKKDGVSNKNEMAELIAKIETYVDNKVYKGIPSIVFQLSQVRDAFYYFQKALHIGKIVIQIPKYGPNSSGKFSHTCEIFNDRSSYIITGGLGGLGIEVTKWMRTVGARTIVLVGRSPPNAHVQSLIDKWNADGSNIIVIHGDVGELEGCKRILDGIREMGLPSLRGIMHAAGVLKDNFMSNQKVENIEAVLKPKVFGGWHLHNLTIDYQLEFFVMFSSFSGILGMIGQCNHAGANRYLDALTHYRVGMGLPCTTINWGGWSEIGAAAQIATAAEVISGFRTFTPAQGIAALQTIMTSREVQVAVSEVLDWNTVKTLFSQGKWMDEIKTESFDDKKFEKYDYLIDEIKAAQTFEERQEKIQIYIEAILKQTLNLPDSDVLDIDQNFSELGVDSLMAMEMKNRFQNIIGNRTLSITSLQENRTIRSLSAHLAQVMENEPMDTRPLEEVIPEDVVLPPEIVPAEIPAVKPSEFKNVFITGVTGHLGVHCLIETLNTAPHLMVHCLIRAKTDAEAEERLQKHLAKYRITLKHPDQVKAVAGDLTKLRMGLSPERYDILSNEIDGIIHCAAKSNHLDAYMDGSRHDIRTHNVLGTGNLLRFAVSNRTKHFMHASSLFAANKITASGHVEEEFPDETDMAEKINMGYLLSKFVAEKLVGEARRRGVPVKCIRFPFIFGNSVTGHMPVENDHIWSTILASIRVRLIPRGHLNGLPLIAVDSAAKVTAHLFLTDSAEDGMYNMTVNSCLSEDHLIEGLEEFGIPCDLVPFKEWTDAVFEEQDASLMAPLARLYTGENPESRIREIHGLSHEMENVKISYFSQKMIKNFMDVESIVPSAQVIVRRQVRAHLAGVNKPVSNEKAK